VSGNESPPFELPKIPYPFLENTGFALFIQASFLGILEIEARSFQ
jgi:hypothetical protein